jgi:hypothetical protein
MLIPSPPKWDPAVDGLDLADSLRQGREFERRFLPRNVVFPKEGQIWQALRECDVDLLAWYSKPELPLPAFVSGPGKAPLFPFSATRFPRGETVRITGVDDPRPLTVSFVPVRYAELQERLVPEYMRTRIDYSHYQLTAMTARTFGIEKAKDYFIDCFKWLREDGAAA